MKNEVDKKLLNSALKGFIKRLEKTEKFVLDQTPDICQQIVKEKYFDFHIDLIVSATFFIFALISILILTIQMYNHPADASCDFWIPRGILSVADLVFLFASGESLVNSIKNIYYIKKCPKLFLLREFKKLADS